MDMYVQTLAPFGNFVLVAQLCLPLCGPMDSYLPVSVHGILQPGILEWVAISFSRVSSQPRDQTRVSSVAGGCFTIWADDLFSNSQFARASGEPAGQVCAVFPAAGRHRELGSDHQRAAPESGRRTPSCPGGRAGSGACSAGSSLLS